MALESLDVMAADDGFVHGRHEPQTRLHGRDAKEVAMSTKVAKVGVERESGWLYYLDKKGHVSRVRMARGGGKGQKSKPQIVAKAGVEREPGFLYFVDKDGDIARARMARPGSRGKSSARRASAKAKPTRRPAAKSGRRITAAKKKAARRR